MADTPVDVDPTKVLAERDEALKKVRKAERALEKVTKDRDRLKDEVQDVKGRLNMALQRIEPLQAKLDEVNAEERLKERDSLRKQFGEAQSRVSKAEKLAKEKDGEIASQRREINRLKNQLEQVASTMEQMQRRRDSAMDQEKAAISEKSAALGRVSNLEEKLAKLTKDLEAAGKEKVQLQTEVKALRRSPRPAGNG